MRAGSFEQDMASADYDSIVRAFEWDIPAFYNLGSALSGGSGQGLEDTALVVVGSDNRGHRVSYGALHKAANKLANLLYERGLRAGDRVAVMLPPSFEAAVAHIAVLKAGLITMPLFPENQTGYAERLLAGDARAILTTERLTSRHENDWTAIPDLRILPILGRTGKWPGSALERLTSHCRTDFPDIAVPANAPAILSFTSGSEGAPKGVLHSHSLVLGILPSLIFTRMPVRGDLIWSPFDWGWLGGLLVAFGAWHRASTILVEQEPSLAPEAIVSLLRSHEVNRVSIAPTMLRMWQHSLRSMRFPALTSITSGGEKLDSDTRGWVRDKFGTELSELYGMTECSAVLGSGYAAPPKDGAIGKPAPGQNVQIISEHGNILGAGQIGEIAVKAPHPAMFLGYWRNEEATRQKYCGEYLRTGDLGYRDEEGYFSYVSRADDIIMCAGHRIGPSEIEEAIAASRAVSRCAAIGVPDKVSGEAVVVWIELKEGVTGTPDLERQIISGARAKLATYQLPARVRFVAEMPLTSSGKVSRSEVKRMEVDLVAQETPPSS